MHESSRKELVRSKQSLESQLEHVSSSSKAELREEREQHRGVVERNNTELEEVWEGCGHVGMVMWVWLMCAAQEEVGETWEVCGHYKRKAGRLA